MKKINLFNRNTICRYTGLGSVSGGFNRGGRIPAFAGMTMIVIAVLFSTSSFAAPTELDKKTVASKAYVDTKQDIIPTDKVLAIDPDGTEYDVYVPAIVTTNADGTELNGNSIGLLSLENIDAAGSNGVADFERRDDLVPTIGLIANEFSLVYDELDAKQDIIPGGTSGNVVTYTGNEGEVGSAIVSSAATYLGTTLTNGANIANITAVETKQDKFTCAGYEPGHEGDMNYCWLYGEIEATATACKQSNESCVNNSECCSNYCEGRVGSKTCALQKIKE